MELQPAGFKFPGSHRREFIADIPVCIAGRLLYVPVYAGNHVAFIRENGFAFSGDHLYAGVLFCSVVFALFQKQPHVQQYS